MQTWLWVSLNFAAFVSSSTRRFKFYKLKVEGFVYKMFPWASPLFLSLLLSLIAQIFCDSNLLKQQKSMADVVPWTDEIQLFVTIPEWKIPIRSPRFALPKMFLSMRIFSPGNWGRGLRGVQHKPCGLYLGRGNGIITNGGCLIPEGKGSIGILHHCQISWILTELFLYCHWFKVGWGKRMFQSPRQIWRLATTFTAHFFIKPESPVLLQDTNQHLLFSARGASI